MQEPLISRLA